MAGFRNDTMYANNVDFTGSSTVSPTITTNGQLLIGSTASPNIRVGNLTSPDNSITFGYSSPNITAVVNTAVVRDLHVTPYIVSAAGLVNGANYTNIQAACDAANTAGGGIVVVQPGTYTENLVLYNGVHIMGLQFADAGGGVNIVGTHTPPATGGFAFQYVSLSSATNIFNSAVAGSAHLILGNAAVNVTNGYTFNLPNWTGKLESFDVNAAIGTSDGYINNTGGATIAIFECSIGSGTANVMTISGPYFVDGIAVYCPVNFVTGATLGSDFSTYNQAITLSNNSTGYLRNCTFTGGASAAITMSSSAAIEISHAVVSSSNNPAIAGAGAGTLTYTDINFLSNAAIAGTLTLATVPWRPYSVALAASDATKVGTCNFNSAQFTVDANGFVSTTGNTMAWQQISANQTLVKNTGYFCISPGGALSLALPSTASSTIGDIIEVTLDGATSWTITQAAAQQIRFSGSQTTAGATGTLASTAAGDSIRMVYQASGKWNVVSSIGNLTVT